MEHLGGAIAQTSATLVLQIEANLLRRIPMAKPRTVEQIQRDRIRKYTELLKIEYRLMSKVRPPRALTRIRERARQSSDPRDSSFRDSALR